MAGRPAAQVRRSAAASRCRRRLQIHPLHRLRGDRDSSADRLPERREPAVHPRRGPHGRNRPSGSARRRPGARVSPAHDRDSPALRAGRSPRSRPRRNAPSGLAGHRPGDLPRFDNVADLARRIRASRPRVSCHRLHHRRRAGTAHVQSRPEQPAERRRAIRLAGPGAIGSSARSSSPRSRWRSCS